MAKGGQTKESAALKPAWKLFDAGDKLAARREAEKVLAAPASPLEADEARDLIARTEPPPVFFKLAAMAAGLIIALIVIALLRS